MTTAKLSLTLAAVMSAAMVLSVKAEDRQQQGNGTQEKSQEVQKKGKGKKQRNGENSADVVFASAAWQADLSGEEPV